MKSFRAYSTAIDRYQGRNRVSLIVDCLSGAMWTKSGLLDAQDREFREESIREEG